MPTQTPIYLDYQATTPVDPRVLETMLPYFQHRFGNASSKAHRFGWEAEAAVKRAREQCAAAIGADPDEIVFTSGSTEAINLAIKGSAEADPSRRHLITAATEHSAVLEVADWLEQGGGRGPMRVTRLPVDRQGHIDLEQLADAIGDDTLIVCLMAANNEIGTRHPLTEVGRLCRDRGVLFFSDATQGVGKFPLDVGQDRLDMLSFSGHKLYGPKGVGALYVRGGLTLPKQQHGGGQEGMRRAGTLNVPGIVGLGRAVELAVEQLDEEVERLAALRDRLWDGLDAALDRIHKNGDPTFRLPGNLNVTFEFVDSEALMMDLHDVAVSSGSACGSGKTRPSHVMTAIGLSEEHARSSIRFGIGRMTTEEEIDRAVASTVAAVRRLRELSPMYELAADADPTSAPAESTTEDQTNPGVRA